MFFQAVTGKVEAKATMVPLRITVSDATRATELLEFLRGLGADVSRESDNEITIARRHAVVPGEPPDQHRVEIEFVVRAWARQRPDAQYQVEEAAEAFTSRTA